MSWLINPRSIPVNYINTHTHLHDIGGIAYIYFNYEQQSSQTIIAIISCLIVRFLENNVALELQLYELYFKNDNGKRKPSLENMTDIPLKFTPYLRKSF